MSLPMISVCTLCTHVKFVDIAFSSKLDMLDEKIMDRKNEIGKTENRPWGNFTILDEGNGYKVKRIEVFPGKRLSYQKHARRAEHWFIVAGTAKITLNGKELLLPSGESIDIAIESAHRVENPEDTALVFIETQTGDYFGEDDIVRLEDDFGRVA